MARGRNQNKTVKIQPTISAQQLDYLEQLVEIGNYGNTPTAVALHLIQLGLTQFINSGVIDTKRPKKNDV